MPVLTFSLFSIKDLTWTFLQRANFLSVFVIFFSFSKLPEHCTTICSTDQTAAVQSGTTGNGLTAHDQKICERENSASTKYGGDQKTAATNRNEGLRDGQSEKHSPEYLK